MLRALPLLALAVLALPAHAADRLSSARAEVQQAQTRDGQLAAEQGRLGQELEGLGARISELKAQGRKLVASAELEGDLRHSQELSTQLNALASQRQQASEALTRARGDLASLLGEELSTLRGEWDRQGSHQARAQLVARMRALRHEREQVLAAMPAASVPALSPLRASDDPEDLLEQADAARDAIDKVRSRLKSLDERIAEARQERELERRLNDFATDQGAFDEQDRTLRLNQDPHARTTESYSASPGPTPLSDSSSGGPNAAGAPGAGGEGSFFQPAGAALPPNQGLHALGSSDGAPDDLRTLEAEKAELDALNRQLGGRAAALEEKARALR